MAFGHHKARALAEKQTAAAPPSAPAVTPALCPACGKPVKPGNVYHAGCAYRQQPHKNAPGGKRGPTPLPRPAVERGIPVGLVDTLVDFLGVDESEITLDATLGGDLGADSLDVCEIGLELERRYGVQIEDEALEWEQAPVATVIADLKRAGAQL